MNKIEEYYRPIGHLIVEFQNLEYLIICCIVKMVDENNPNVIASLISPLTFRQHLDVLGAISDYKLPKCLAGELRKIMEKLDKCAVCRNEIIHTYWHDAIDYVVGHKLKVTRKNGLKDVLSKIEISDITNSIHLVKQHNAEIRQIMEKIDKWLVANQNKAKKSAT